MVWKLLLIIACIIFIFNGAGLAFNVQGYLTEIDKLNSYSLMTELKGVWEGDVISAGDNVGIFEGIINSPFIEYTFGTIYKTYLTLGELVEFVKWVWESSDIIQPWRYVEQLRPAYQWR